MHLLARPSLYMKLPHGLSPIWLSIPAIIFILIVGLFVTKLPPFQAATIQNPQGTELILPTPTSNLSKPDALLEIRQTLNNFNTLEAAMQMPIIDIQISLPKDL